MLVNAEMKSALNSLEYWMLKPYHHFNDKDLPYVKQVVGLLQILQTDSLHSAEYDTTLSNLEAAYQENKMAYQHVERRQTEKAIKAMKGSVISRMINKNIIPAATKAVETVRPVVNKAMNETIIPAADKTLRFFHKTFAKKKTEVVEADADSKE
jgi:hypothetical protein